MSEFDHVQLRRLDPTLLLVFVEAVRTRRLSMVAARLGLTPSAVSHAVGRLRDVFGDPLFVRRSAGVEPTARALALAGPVEEALAALTRALAEGRDFDPARLVRTFRVNALDYTVALVAPGLAAAVGSTAPGVFLSFRTQGRAETLRGLAAGEVDLGIGVFDPVPHGFVTTPLYRERFVTVARADHRLLGDGLDLDRFVALDHLLVSGSGDRTGPVDEALARIGRARRVIAAVPQFLAALAVVQTTDAVVTVPESLARAYAGLFGLRIHETPVPVPPFAVVAVRGPLSATDRAVSWLVGLIAAAPPPGTPQVGIPQPGADANVTTVSP